MIYSKDRQDKKCSIQTCNHASTDYAQGMRLCRHHARGDNNHKPDPRSHTGPPVEGRRPPIRFHEEVSYHGGPWDVYSRP
eukprot:10134856-Heterocapsa_arctica.AAC.1